MLSDWDIITLKRAAEPSTMSEMTKGLKETGCKKSKHRREGVDRYCREIKGGKGRVPHCCTTTSEVVERDWEKKAP